MAASKEPSSYCVSFKANLESLPYMLDFVRENIGLIGFDRKSAQRIEIALEEALVNVINHAYPGRLGRVELRSHLFPKERIQFTIKDSGVPFNPLERSCEVDLNLTLEERAEGGLGLKLMKEFMDTIRYERVSDCNVLILEKSLKKIG